MSTSPPPQPVHPEETVLPLLPFRPNLLLILRKFREPGEVYGYEVGSEKLQQLTAAVPPSGTAADAVEVSVSSDGQYFAYLRWDPRFPRSDSKGVLGVCVRGIQGGTTLCRWEKMGDRLDWRPGTHDLWVHGLGAEVRVFRLAAGGLEPIDPPVRVGARLFFTPDGRYAAYDPSGGRTRLADLSQSPIVSVEVPGFEVLWGQRAVEVKGEANLEPELGSLRITELTGETTPLPPSPNARDRIQLLYADPGGRWLAVNYGAGSPVSFRGSTLYDRETSQWLQLPGRALGWTPRTHRLLLRTDRGLALYLPTTGGVSLLNFTDDGVLHSWSWDEDWALFTTQQSQRLQLHRISTGESRALDFGQNLVGRAAFVPATPNTSSKRDTS